MGSDVVGEGDGSVEVCAQLSAAAGRVLECNLIATFSLVNGSKAGTFYRIIEIM